MASLCHVCCRSQVAVSQVVETTSTAVRTGPNDIQVGDVLHVSLETSETPFGDPAVTMDLPRGPDRALKAMKELQTAFETGQPVMGRLLNPLNGGYAVGIGGIVGFCPFRSCSLPTASRIGILQPFYVSGLREVPFNLILSDVNAPHASNPKPNPAKAAQTPAKVAQSPARVPQTPARAGQTPQATQLSPEAQSPQVGSDAHVLSQI